VTNPPRPHLGDLLHARDVFRGVADRVQGLDLDAIASALAIFGPPCAIYYLAHRLWDGFRDAPWQQIARRGLVPVTIGLILDGGTVVARAADTNWQSATVTMVAAALILWVRTNPLWILIAAGTVGALGLL
jgi:chromate transporter